MQLITRVPTFNPTKLLRLNDSDKSILKRHFNYFFQQKITVVTLT